MQIIYLDNAATTPLDPDVLAVMEETGKIHFTNPSSIHTGGQQSRVLIENTRQVIANSIKAKSSEIVFTSGGTEGNNLAIIGTALANQEKGKHIIVSRIEHPSVLEPCLYLKKLGFKISYLDVDECGRLNLEHLQNLITQETILVSLMLVNNETGSILPIWDVADILKNKPVIFHTDAVQALDKMEISVDELQIDLMTMSAHKLFGPKGIGALYIRSGTEIESILFGGSQESGRRAGTENSMGIVGFGKAIEKMAESSARRSYILSLRQFLEIELKKRIPGLLINAEKSDRIPHISNVYFPFMSGDSLLINLDLLGIAVSTGSACSAGSQKPSHVLSALGYEEQRVLNSIRFSLSKNSTKTDILRSVEAISDIYKKNKKASSL